MLYCPAQPHTPGCGPVCLRPHPVYLASQLSAPHLEQVVWLGWSKFQGPATVTATL